ncbi:MAG: ABC transporter permease [Bacillota bacterium]|nr:ABC transporter permease [Bacillota bacterium]
MFVQRQIQVYFSKFSRMLMSTKGLFFLLEAIFLPLVVSFVFQPGSAFVKYSDTEMACFTFVSAAVWIGLFNSILSICSERQVVKFEYVMKGLSIPSYLAARILTELWLCFLEAFLMTMVIVWRYAILQNSLFFFGMLLLTLFIVLFAADMMSLLISSIVKKTNQAMTVMPIVLIVQLIFSNFIKNLDGLSKIIGFISNLTFTKWGGEALFRTANIMSNVSVLGNKESIVLAGDKVNTYVFSGLHVVKCWIIILVLASVCVCLASLVLKNVKKDAR